MESTYVLAEMTEEHGPAIMRIFNHYIETDFSAYFDQAFPDTFFARLRETANGYPAVIAMDGVGAVAGFGFLHAYHPAPAFRRTAELTYFLAPEHTRKGIGGTMLADLTGKARRQGIDRLLASISSLNQGSLSFHGKNGFVEVGRLRTIGVKFGREFDVVYMQKAI